MVSNNNLQGFRHSTLFQNVYWFIFIVGIKKMKTTLSVYFWADNTYLLTPKTGTEVTLRHYSKQKRI